MMQISSASLAIIVLAAIYGSASAQNPCPSADWRYSPHNNKCYRLYNEKIGWTLAEFKCAMQGGHQISVHDVTGNNFLAELARRADIVWLGMAQFGTDQRYIWADASTYDYENWHAKHNYRKPIYNRGKKCAKLDSATQTWMQSCCKVPAAFICQRKASPFVPPPPTPPPVAVVEPQQQEQQGTEAPWWLKSEQPTANGNDLRKFRFRRL